MILFSWCLIICLNIPRCKPKHRSCVFGDGGCFFDSNCILLRGLCTLEYSIHYIDVCEGKIKDQIYFR